MHPVLQKTFGGLSREYYLRQFFFGVALSLLFVFMLSQGNREIAVSTYFFCILNTLLYPYARFVYESIIGFIMGSNVFYINAILMLITKIITMFLCWGFAILIAPIGLLYLYYYHSKHNG